ncbi:MAG: hypothetical protein H6974_12250 [Gammaproteobacteria bacterium]|nr:hypothetical protein [Gammaproteobacteria bacterium]
MNSQPVIREDGSRLSPLAVVGIVLIASGGYLAFRVVAELWAFFLHGQHQFIAVIVEKLNDGDFLFFDGAPVTLGSPAQFVLGIVIFLLLAASFVGVATTLISTGANFLSPQVMHLKDSIHTLGTRVRTLEKDRQK